MSGAADPCFLIMLYILIFVLSFIALYIIWDLSTKKYLSIYKLYILFGKKGCGKSTLLQKIATYYHKRGFNIYCNLGDSTLECVHEIPIKDLPRLSEAGHKIQHYKDKTLALEIEKEYQKKGIKSPCYIKSPAVILCDEINLLWDNRNFKSFPPEMQAYFRLQRHYRHIFFGFSQTYDCDLKIKNLADELMIVSRVARVWIRTKSYVKKVVVVSPEDGNSRDTAIMTDDFVRLGMIHDLFSPYQAWLPKWIKKHDSFK